jgi:hypothetical protein
LITIARDLVQVPECRNIVRNLSPYIRVNIDARRRQFAVHSSQSTVRSQQTPRPRSAVAVPVGARHEVMTRMYGKIEALVEDRHRNYDKMTKET